MHRKLPIVVLGSLLFLTLIVGLVLGITKPVQASVIKDGGIVSADETIDNDVFLSGENIKMDGTINGLLIATGQTVTVNGTINGDAFLAGSTVIIGKEAKITGNLFFGCQNAEINGVVEGSVAGGSASMVIAENGAVGRNLYYGGYSLEIQPDIKTAHDVYAGVYQAILGGEIGRNVKIEAGAVELNGEVGGDVSIDFGSDETTAPEQPPFFYFPGMNIEMPKAINPGLRVGPDAKIGGKLTYTASNENLAEIEAKPKGGVVYQTPVPSETIEGEQAQKEPVKVNVIKPFIDWLFKTIRLLVTLLLLGGLAVWLIPELMKRLVTKVKEKPVPSAGYGFVVIVIGYAAAIFAALVVLMVGILFMVITLGGLGGTIFTIGFSSIAVIMAIFGFLVSYGSKLIVSFLAGLWIMQLIWPAKEPARGWAMVVGVVIYTILRSIPFIGWIFGLLATLFGIGAIWLLIREMRTSRQVPDVLPTTTQEG